MIKNIPYIENLVALYLKGEASPDQAVEIEDWKSQSTENNKMFEQMEQTFFLTHNLNHIGAVKKQDSWEVVNTHIKASVLKTPLWKNPLLYYAAAASLVLGLMLPILWKDYFTPILTSEQRTQEKIKTIESSLEKISMYYSASIQNLNIDLMDESKVLLVKGSNLTLAKDFNQTQREMKLEGSATFTVTHNEKKPFKVFVHKLEILDIGTVFEVKSGQDTVRILVLEGAVELRLNNQLIEMQQGDSAFYILSKQVIKQYEEKSARINKVFEFDGTKLSEVAIILSSFYHKNISVSKEIQDCEISVTFKNEELATILDVIKELMDIKLVTKDQKIELYGNECK